MKIIRAQIKFLLDEWIEYDVIIESFNIIDKSVNSTSDHHNLIT